MIRALDRVWGGVVLAALVAVLVGLELLSRTMDAQEAARAWWPRRGR